MRCFTCDTENNDQDTHCRSCGNALTGTGDSESSPGPDTAPARADAATLPRVAVAGSPHDAANGQVGADGEYRQVTVLFADLSGYSGLTSDFGPEIVQGLMSRLFREIQTLVEKHGGVVERFFGDEVMVLFGLPVASEDDPIRAVKLAEDIHRTMARLDSDGNLGLDRPLSMHIGISTGAVVTGEELIGDHRHGITGQTINVASQLVDEAGDGMTLVGPETHACAEAFFTFESIPPLEVQGELTPLPAYRVVSRRRQPRKVRRRHGLSAPFAGRNREMAQLRDAAAQVRTGNRLAASISGKAGVGKSRLVDEFKAETAVQDMRWMEGHAYQCTRNIPFGPLVQLFNHLYDIPPDAAADEKAASLGVGMAHIASLEDDHRHCLESLYLSPHPALEGVTPETWQLKLQEAVREVLKAETADRPAVICFEDLHWSDPSFIELFHSTLMAMDGPILILYTFRPFEAMAALTEEPADDTEWHIHLALRELSLPESTDMVMEMLGADVLPGGLMNFVNVRSGGNPFFVEELVNALVDSGDLAAGDGTWSFSPKVDDYRIPATVQGLVTSRIDRLGLETRNLLQAAAVIGSTFHHRLLAELTGTDPGDVEEALYALGDTELVRPMAATLEKNFAFTHTIIHNVVYEGLLVSDRQKLHERTAKLLEQRAGSSQRTSSEIIAHHFERGESPTLAVAHLMTAIGGSMKIHAAEEAHRCCRRAFALLTDISHRTPEEDAQLVDLLIDWFFVYDVRGLFSNILERLLEYEPVAAASGPDSRLGMYYVCIGWAMQRREHLEESRQYLFKALHIGEATGDSRVMAYASACLIWTCTDSGDLNEAISFGNRAEHLMQEHRDDQLLVRLVLTGIGIANWFIGNVESCWIIGRKMLDFGTRGADIRTVSDGHLVFAMGDFVAGDLAAAEVGCRKAIEVSVGLVHSLNAKFLLAYTYLGMERLDDAGDLLAEITDFCESGGYEYLGSSASALTGVVLAGRGNLRSGFGRLKEHRRLLETKGKRYHCLVFDYILGSMFLQLGISPEVPAAIRRFVRAADWTRLPFLPLRRSEQYLSTAYAEAERIGAKNMMGMIAQDLGALYREKGDLKTAGLHYENAAMMFRACGAPKLSESAEAERRALGKYNP